MVRLWAPKTPVVMLTAMGLIDEKTRFGGAVKPLLWWRYKDDVFDVWTHGLPKLLEFTEYINSIYPTIKFELVYSEHTLNVLDLTLHLQDGFIITDIYAKPTDSHLYLPFSSSHPAHCKRAIPDGRILLTCDYIVGFPASSFKIINIICW